MRHSKVCKAVVLAWIASALGSTPAALADGAWTDPQAATAAPWSFLPAVDLQATGAPLNAAAATTTVDFASGGSPPTVQPAGWFSGLGADSGLSYNSEVEQLDPTCDECPRHVLIGLVGYDSWRNVTDGNWQNNGIHSGVNFGTRLGPVSDLTGIGFQIGATAAAVNWAGTDYRLVHQDQTQAQGFVTYGLFRHANEFSNWSAAIVQDWMINSNYGVFGQNPTIGQWRGQAGYAVNAWNELGVWGAWRARGDTRNIIGFGQTDWRAVNQLNGYWHYKWGPDGADTWIWFGRPEDKRLGGNGSLGDWTVGLFGNFPISERVSLYALVTYMHQSAAAGGVGAREDAWNFTTGVSFFPARNARSKTVAGQCWAPLLPVANNGWFLVDTNRNY